MKAIKYGLIFAGLFVVYEVMTSKKASAGTSAASLVLNQYPSAWGDYWNTQKTTISADQKQAIQNEILKGNVRFL